VFVVKGKKTQFDKRSPQTARTLKGNKMKFEFELRSPIHTSIIEADVARIVRGRIEASDPRDAAEKIVNEHRSDLNDGFDYFTPEFEIARNRDGSFSVEVDTHGLVDATIELEKVS
jgi:hypothetical protein